jgi:starvation-inducible DNA-binding protein
MAKTETLTKPGDIGARLPEGGKFNPDTGIETKGYREIAEALGPVLADSFQLFIKTQGVHWNVSGSNFYGLHKLTEAQYGDIYAAIDEIAERIRALGQPAPASYSTYGRLSSIRDEEEPDGVDAMVAMLINDNGTLCKTMRRAIAVSDRWGDVVTTDLLTKRLAQHEQNSWMLNMVARS